MKKNNLKALGALGQSVWLDYIRRDLVEGGELRRLIEEDGITGITSNPAIFEEAITGEHFYDGEIRAMAREGKTAECIYGQLTRSDVQKAADEFRPVYDRTDGADGYVSLEVDPHLAHDSGGTIKEARQLWAALARPNVMIKVPATEEGLSAVRHLISEGINVNVTLLFGLPRYRQAAEAYIAGLEERLGRGQPVNRVASVASFFLSRIDTLLDPVLERVMALRGKTAGLAGELRGQTAIASAKAAYRIYGEIFGGRGFGGLAAKGARAQRLLWASTGTKNPEYSDVKYVDTLIGPDTVNTMPVKTLNAYRAHGAPKASLVKNAAEAERILKQLPALGIDLDEVTRQLETEGVQKFNAPYDKLLAALAQRMRAV